MLSTARTGSRLMKSNGRTTARRSLARRNEKLNSAWKSSGLNMGINLAGSNAAFGSRRYHHEREESSRSSHRWENTYRYERMDAETMVKSNITGGGLLAGALMAIAAFWGLVASGEASDNERSFSYDDVRKDIEALIDDPDYDDGSYGPIFVRLAWHASGTYDMQTKTGGSFGGTMRFAPEANDGANAGLHVARERLEPLKAKYGDGLSYGDLWTLAGAVAIEYMGGPEIAWRPGRVDAKDETACPPVGRLPDASKGEDHIREVFGRMGFNDREMTALIGAHAIGRCHPDRSGYWGPWTRSPTMFSNDFYVQLLEQNWVPKEWDGPFQYVDEPTGEIMMLPGDMAFRKDPTFLKYVKMYAEDEELFFKDFAAAFSKLLDLGLPGNLPGVNKK